MSTDDHTPDIKAATGRQALPSGSDYSPLPDRRGTAIAEAIPDDDETDPLPPPADARRARAEDLPEADSI